MPGIGCHIYLSVGARLRWRTALWVMVALSWCNASVAGSYGWNAQLSTYCAADAKSEIMPTTHLWQAGEDATVTVEVGKPCWVQIQPNTDHLNGNGPTFLVLTESLALDVRAYDQQGQLLARSAPNAPHQNAFSVGKLVLLEHMATQTSPIFLHMALIPKATQYKQMEPRIEWAFAYAVLPPVELEMSISLLVSGALAFVILLSCALAFALRRTSFALAGLASLINVQYLVGSSGASRILNLPSFVFAVQDELLMAGFGMLLVFIVEFCNFRQHCKRTAYALLSLAALCITAALWLLVEPGAFVSFDIYEWLRLPAYGLMLYGLVNGLRLKQVTAAMCLAALVPDYLYLFFYTMPQLHWLLGDTAVVKLPEFAQPGSVFELFVVLWLPLMLCLALIHRVQTVERERTKAALTDSLTGLPNRTGLGIALRHFSGDFTTIVLDLNRFKSIDLALGRILGDEVLKEFAARLKVLPGATVARLYSDRFAVVMPGQWPIENLTAQIDALLIEPLHVQGQVVDLSATLGVSCNNEAVGLEQHVRQAEVALHHARQQRTTALSYSPSLEKPKRNDLSLMSDLHQAVANQELRLFLQPKVLLRDGSVSAAEGLVRWQHPQRGMVPPSEFVNFAEQIGRIGFITRWVLQEAMQIVAQQRKSGTPMTISVNISSVDLADDNFVHLVSELARQTGAQPCDIKLEITESAAMEEPEHALAAMHRLHDLGFKWSLDDFGTGYSSLSYLQKMPLSELKVDRAFVCNVTPDSDAAKLLGSVIALGHQFGLTVVAEGAETKAEWELLRTLGADMVQGWYAAKAMPLPDFLQWCQANPRFGV